MGTPTIYHSGDTGAPVLNGTAGSLVAVLKACLVDGYGSKAAAGWTMPDINGANEIALFRNAEDRVLRVQDDGLAPNPDARWAAVTAAATGNGIDDVDLVDLYPQSRVAGWVKSPDADSSARDWYVFADEKRFYFFPHTQSGQVGSGADAGKEYKFYFFGKIKSYKPGDTAPYMLIAIEAGGGSTFSNASNGVAFPYFSDSIRGNTTPAANKGMHQGLMQDIDGNVGASWSWVSHYPLRATSQSMWSKPASGSGSYPNPVTGVADIGPIEFEEPAKRVPRGRMPGAFELLHRMTRANNPTPFAFEPSTETFDMPWGQGKTVYFIPLVYWLSLTSGDNASGTIGLDVESDWDSA